MFHSTIVKSTTSQTLLLQTCPDVHEKSSRGQHKLYFSWATSHNCLGISSRRGLRGRYLSFICFHTFSHTLCLFWADIKEGVDEWLISAV